MNITPIEWCDMSWNPVTGCLHDCHYCYARKQVKRFKGYDNELCPDMAITAVAVKHNTKIIFELKEKLQRTTKKGKLVTATFPFGFDPTFHKYRLNDPAEIKTPKNIFVCSMADLFGDFIPDEWIQKVLNACKEAPQHRYLFLTKNPARYLEFQDVLPKDDNFWYGTTITTQNDDYLQSYNHNTFLSIEPLQEAFYRNVEFIVVGWVIIGAETGNRKNKIIPKKGWIENIVERCDVQGIPVFMKDSLADIWGEPLIRQFPWDKERRNG